MRPGCPQRFRIQVWGTARIGRFECSETGRQIRVTFWGESGTGNAPGKASALSPRADHARPGVAGLEVDEPPAHHQHVGLCQLADVLRALAAVPRVLRLCHQYRIGS